MTSSALRSLRNRRLLRTIARTVPHGPGLSPTALEEMRTVYGGSLPDELELLLRRLTPLGSSLPLWTNPSEEFAATNDGLVRTFLFDSEHGYWPENFGSMPDDLRARTDQIRARIREGPPLVRIHAHRYVPAIEGPDWQVLSIAQATDTIIIAANVLEYFASLGTGRRKPHEPVNWKRRIPFWMDCLEW